MYKITGRRCAKSTETSIEISSKRSIDLVHRFGVQLVSGNRLSSDIDSPSYLIFLSILFSPALPFPSLLIPVFISRWHLSYLYTTTFNAARYPPCCLFFSFSFLLRYGCYFISPLVIFILGGWSVCKKSFSLRLTFNRGVPVTVQTWPKSVFWPVSVFICLRIDAVKRHLGGDTFDWSSEANFPD